LEAEKPEGIMEGKSAKARNAFTKNRINSPGANNIGEQVFAGAKKLDAR